MAILRYKSIGIDFDGTIVDDDFPSAGPVKPHAVRVINKIREYGGKVVIWTCRTGEDAEYAKRILKSEGIEYDAFNDNLPETLAYFPDNGRKVFCDIYIDDRGIYAAMNGGIDWLEVENFLFIGNEGENYVT